jgi:hypothetical protein
VKDESTESFDGQDANVRFIRNDKIVNLFQVVVVAEGILVGLALCGLVVSEVELDEEISGYFQGN